jgi:hypothetical protein
MAGAIIVFVRRDLRSSTPSRNIFKRCGSGLRSVVARARSRSVGVSLSCEDYSRRRPCHISSRSSRYRHSRHLFRALMGYVSLSCVSFFFPFFFFYLHFSLLSVSSLFFFLVGVWVRRERRVVVEGLLFVMFRFLCSPASSLRAVSSANSARGTKTSARAAAARDRPTTRLRTRTTFDPLDLERVRSTSHIYIGATTQAERQYAPSRLPVVGVVENSLMPPRAVVDDGPTRLLVARPIAPAGRGAGRPAVCRQHVRTSELIQ